MKVTDYNSVDSILQISCGIFGYVTSKLPYVANFENFDTKIDSEIASVLNKFYDLIVLGINIVLLYYALMIASKCKNNKFVEFLFAICFSLPYILVRGLIMKCS